MRVLGFVLVSRTSPECLPLGHAGGPPIADPDDDPRDTGGLSPDGELATLADYLAT